MTTDAIIAAAENLNRANVAAAQTTGERLYRDVMTPEARALDEAFQAHYEAQQPSTTGPRPIPPLRDRVEIDAKAVGLDWKMSDECRREIEDIENNAALARLNAKNIVFR